MFCDSVGFVFVAEFLPLFGIFCGEFQKKSKKSVVVKFLASCAFFGGKNIAYENVKPRWKAVLAVRGRVEKSDFVFVMKWSRNGHEIDS